MNDKAIPEEVNKWSRDHISVCSLPLPVCMDNLHREGLTPRVYLTGDVMLDCFMHFSKEAEKRTGIMDNLGIEKVTTCW